VVSGQWRVVSVTTVQWLANSSKIETRGTPGLAKTLDLEWESA
jgi:hypothetical protein